MSAIAQRRRATWQEIGALILLPVGAIVLPFIGWVVGVVLLWVSDAWSTRDKWIGTLVLPGGLGLFFVTTLGAVGGSSSVSVGLPPLSHGCGPHVVACQWATLHVSSTTSLIPAWAKVAIAIVLLVAPLASVAHLIRARGRLA